MEMNQKTAFKILGLGSGASLAQVKKAFRDLAKRYHPDRFLSDPSALEEGVPAQAEARLNRMKEINQAFHFLVPLLTSAQVSQDKASADRSPSSKTKKDRASDNKRSRDKDPSFLDMLGRFKKRFSAYRKPVSTPNPSAQPSLKPREPQKRNPVKKVRFATLLNTLHPAGTYDKKTMDCGRDCTLPSRSSRGFVRTSEAPPYNRFLKYMALKKQMDAGKRASGEQNYSRIEKIRPVTRVNPIGSKHKS